MIRTRRRSATMFVFLATLMMVVVALTREFRDEIHSELTVASAQH